MTLDSSKWNSVTHPHPLFTDLYELAMMQAYHEEDMKEDATFSLYVRRLPSSRNFLLACGLETVLDYVESLCFDDCARERATRGLTAPKAGHARRQASCGEPSRSWFDTEFGERLRFKVPSRLRVLTPADAPLSC
jgi:hypothetical protein